MREDWVEVELKEVCQINMGQSPPSSTYNTDKIGLPFFQGKAEFTELHPVVEKWCSEPTKIAEQNDILLSVRAPVGATNVANQRCAIGRGLAAISYKHDYSYILYFLRLIEKKLDSQGTGTTFRAISGAVLKSQIIPLAPLPIQRAIVLKIENLFASLDKGIADLKTAQEQLKVYRQAVLKKAFEGKLTKNLNHDSKDSFDDHDLPMVAENIPEYNNQGNQVNPVNQGSDCLPERWKWGKLGEVALKITDGEHFRPKTTDAGIFFLSAKDVRENGVDFSKPLYISPETAEKALKRCNPEKGDILIVSRGATVGRMCIVNTDHIFCLLGSVILIKVKKEISSLYLTYFLKSPLANQILVGLSGSTAQQAIYLRDIKNVEIVFPPTLAEQHAIVREIESRLSVCDKVEQNIAEALEKAEALRQSILKKAFEGRLLSEDEIEKCKQSADYEPASVLLERIKKEKKK